MAEHDFVIDNGTGAAVRADINNVLQAIASNNSKSGALTTNFAFQWHVDTSDGLLKIRNEVDNNKNIDQVISTIKPPIFWKEKEIVKKQAQSWSTNEVKNKIFKINDLEALVKKTNSNTMLFVSNFVSNY